MHGQPAQSARRSSRAAGSARLSVTLLMPSPAGFGQTPIVCSGISDRPGQLLSGDAEGQRAVDEAARLAALRGARSSRTSGRRAGEVARDTLLEVAPAGVARARRAQRQRRRARCCWSRCNKGWRGTAPCRCRARSIAPGATHFFARAHQTRAQPLVRRCRRRRPPARGAHTPQSPSVFSQCVLMHCQLDPQPSPFTRTPGFI